MATLPQPYSTDFYSRVLSGAARSAREIVPIAVDLIAPRSIVDVGCGLGAWLSAFQQEGVNDVFGVDGEWIDRAELELAPEQFQSSDLRQPLQIGREFDLALALEVAEHLPVECAETFVDSLVRLAPVVLFSAAIPFQGGMAHLNEQWPDYWAALFERRGYRVVDCIRHRVWQNPSVDYWYAQNMLLFVRAEHLNRHPALERETLFTCPDQLSVVHPRRYLQEAIRASTIPSTFPVTTLLSAFPSAVTKALRRRLLPQDGR